MNKRNIISAGVLKNLVFAFVFILVSLNAKSQIELEISGGYGFYNLDDLKSLQTSALSAIGLPNIKSVETFPDHVFYSLLVGYSIDNKNNIGGKFSYLTTGGRNHLSDYSGEYKLDMILNGYKIGFEYRHLFLSGKKFEAGLQCDGGVIISRLKINEYLKVTDKYLTDTDSKMKNTGFFVEPSVRASYEILKNIKLCFNGGYEFDFRNKLRLNDEKTNVSADWSGVRLSLGIAYCFDKE